MNKEMEKMFEKKVEEKNQQGKNFFNESSFEKVSEIQDYNWLKHSIGSLMTKSLMVMSKDASEYSRNLNAYNNLDNVLGGQ